MSTDLSQFLLNGPTMGTRWSARFYAAPGFDPRPVQTALEAVVNEVDAQMSTWTPASDLMRLNAVPIGEWVAIPARLSEVLHLALTIGQVSGGAFDIGLGDAVRAWGFGPDAAVPDAIGAAMRVRRVPAHEVLAFDAAGRVCKRSPITLDLNAIAKGYGTDRLAATLGDFGITSALVGIDGEMRALGLQPDGTAWNTAIEAPDPARRAPHSILALHDAAVATSGDYRHWVTIKGHRLSHTMDPRRGAPLLESPASVSVIAQTCAEADAFATALLVLGVNAGVALARHLGIDALFLRRDDMGFIRATAVGRIFAPKTDLDQDFGSCHLRAEPSP